MSLRRPRGNHEPNRLNRVQPAANQVRRGIKKKLACLISVTVFNLRAEKKNTNRRRRVGKATSHVVNSLATFHLTLLASFCGDLAERLQRGKGVKQECKIYFSRNPSGQKRSSLLFFLFIWDSLFSPSPSFSAEGAFFFFYTEREREKRGGKGGGEFPSSLLRGNSRREEPAAISFSIRLPSPFPHLTFPNTFSPLLFRVGIFPIHPIISSGRLSTLRRYY